MATKAESKLALTGPCFAIPQQGHAAVVVAAGLRAVLLLHAACCSVRSWDCSSHCSFYRHQVRTTGAGDHTQEWSSMEKEGRPHLDPEVAAVVVGWCSTVNFVQFTLASMYIRYANVPFIATNRDASAPFLPDGETFKLAHRKRR